MYRGRRLPFQLLGLCLLATLSCQDRFTSSPGCGACLAMSPSANTLIVEFAGMVDLVSDKTGKSPSWVLAPNATDPGHFKPNLPSDTFSPAHEPILQLHAGRLTSETKVTRSSAVPCSDYLQGGSPSWALASVEVTSDLADEAKVAQDRTPIGIKPKDSSSLNLLASLDPLAMDSLGLGRSRAKEESERRTRRATASTDDG